MIIGPVIVIYSSFTTRVSVFSRFGFFGARIFGYCNRTSLGSTWLHMRKLSIRGMHCSPFSGFHLGIRACRRSSQKSGGEACSNLGEWGIEGLGIEVAMVVGGASLLTGQKGWGGGGVSNHSGLNLKGGVGLPGHPPGSALSGIAEISAPIFSLMESCWTCTPPPPPPPPPHPPSLKLLDLHCKCCLYTEFHT